MEWTEEQKKLLDKAEFYRSNEIKAHVLTIPKGTFKNGRFASPLEGGKFFWFIEDNGIVNKSKMEEKEQTINIASRIPITLPFRLFLSEIHDIKDYVEDENE